MTKDMQKYIKPYNFPIEMIDFIFKLEEAYQYIWELCEEKGLTNGEALTPLPNWFDANTKSEFIADLIDKEKFLFALGILSYRIATTTEEIKQTSNQI